MTFEEMEKTMAFILEQQAQSTVKQAKADERIDRLERVVTLAARNVQRERKETRDKMHALIDATTALTGAQNRADERHAETEESIAILTTAMTDLAQALIVTNQRVDKLESGGQQSD